MHKEEYMGYMIEISLDQLPESGRWIPDITIWKSDQESAWGTYRSDSPDFPTEEEARDYGLQRAKQIVNQNI